MRGNPCDPCDDCKKADSPGLKNAKLNKKGVSKKIETFEKEIVCRSKIKISPNKIRKKELLVKSEKEIKLSQIDKNDKKPQKCTSKDKNVLLEKLKLMKAEFTEKENNGKDEVKPTDETDEKIEVLKLGDGFKHKNAFQILLKSANGGITPTQKPRRYKSKKKIGSMSQGSAQKCLKDWLLQD